MDDFSIDWENIFSDGTLGGDYTPSNNPYDIWSGQDIYGNTPSLNDSSQTWIDYFNGISGSGWSDADIEAAINSAGSSGGLSGALSKLLGSDSAGASVAKMLGMLGAGYGVSNQVDWQQLLGQGRDLAGKTGTLISGYQPYTNQMVNMSEAQKQMAGYAPDILSQGKSMFMGSGTYDPTKVNSYLNPYVEGGLATANKLTTRNLMENTLPGINSTFTGAGQFGSSRNGEFLSRAIRDNQQSIANSNSTAMVDAYDSANKNYMDMLERQKTVGQGALEAGSKFAALPVTQYKDMYMSPLEMFKTWSGGVGQFNPAGSGNNGSVDLSGIAKLFGG